VGSRGRGIWSQGTSPLVLAHIKIHIDSYRHELFASIKSPETWTWGPYLLGHTDKCRRLPGVADHTYEGHLTTNPETTFHSCDSLGRCPVRDSANVVQIIPVTNHVFTLDNEEISASADILDVTSDSQDQSSVSKRKHKAELDRSLKRPKLTMSKEPGHTLLAPIETSGIRASTASRPPIYNREGQSLSYYIVLGTCYVSHK
jgi:hypothetical protein